MFRVRRVGDFTDAVIASRLAVKGPTGPAGTEMVTPELGIGLGIGTPKDCGLLCSEAGRTTPVTWTVVVSVPLMTEFPSAAAALTISLGRRRVVW